MCDGLGRYRSETDCESFARDLSWVRTSRFAATWGASFAQGVWLA